MIIVLNDGRQFVVRAGTRITYEKPRKRRYIVFQPRKGKELIKEPVRNVQCVRPGMRIYP